MKLDVKIFTKEQIEEALQSEQLKTFNQNNNYKSHHYDLIVENKRIPVKNVFRAAFIISGGDVNEKLDFNASVARRRLEKLGYVVEDKEEEFYTKEDYDLLERWSGTKYDKSNPDHKEAITALKKVYNKTAYLAKLMKSKLGGTFQMEVIRNPLKQSQHFDHYHWAKLYPSPNDKKDKFLAFTVGIEKASIVCKIDTVGLTENDPIRKEYFDLRGDFNNSEIVLILTFDELQIQTWEDLEQKFISFIRRNSEAYRDIKRKLAPLTDKTVDTSLINQEKRDPKVDYPLNQILYGPPGTGKTRRTVQLAANLIEGNIIKDYSNALEIFKQNLHDRIEFITFHQNYSYEDFVQGLRPVTEGGDGQLSFFVSDGIFKKISDKALQNYKDWQTGNREKLPFETVLADLETELAESEKGTIIIPMKRVSYEITDIGNIGISFRKASGGTGHNLSIGTLKRYYNEGFVDTREGGLTIYYRPLVERLLKSGETNISKQVDLKKYVLIIDEINRANISRVFGELITLIEKDKRYGGEIPLSCKLPSGEKLMVPPNLYIIGTMNTADKSIALLDIALRRRFDFVPMYPKYEIEGAVIHDVDLLKNINEYISEERGKGVDFCIGHSYFMDKKDDNYNRVSRFNNRILPLLMEYFMNDRKSVVQLLKNAISKTYVDGKCPFAIDTDDIFSLKIKSI